MNVNDGMGLIDEHRKIGKIEVVPYKEFLEELWGGVTREGYK